MRFWTPHTTPIPRPDLISRDARPHAWRGNRFGPLEATRNAPADKTLRPPPIDPWREAKQHFGRIVADAKK